MRYVLKFITIILPRPTKFCQYFILLIENFNLYMASRVAEKIKLQSVDELSAEKRMERCEKVKLTCEIQLKEYCVLREHGYHFD